MTTFQPGGINTDHSNRVGDITSPHSGFRRARITPGAFPKGTPERKRFRIGDKVKFIQHGKVGRMNRAECCVESLSVIYTVTKLWIKDDSQYPDRVGCWDPRLNDVFAYPRFALERA